MCVVESSLSGKTHPSTPAMYKFRPSFGTMPKVHYHTAGEKVRQDLFSTYVHDTFLMKCHCYYAVICSTLIAIGALLGAALIAAVVKDNIFVHIPAQI